MSGLFSSVRGRKLPAVEPVDIASAFVLVFFVWFPVFVVDSCVESSIVGDVAVGAFFLVPTEGDDDDIVLTEDDDIVVAPGLLE